MCVLNIKYVCAVYVCGRKRVRECERDSDNFYIKKCEQVCFVQVFTVILPRLSYPYNFINCTANKQGTRSDKAFVLLLHV